ncbi:MAG: hypothetical protein NDJ90_00575 [Oligoflexia bacterium]|nr:hypothetical protein [Oligoflexia bacterium]
MKFILPLLFISALVSPPAFGADAPAERYPILERFEQRLVSGALEGDHLVASSLCRLLSDGTIEFGHGVAKGVGAIIGIPVVPWTTRERDSRLAPEAFRFIGQQLSEARRYPTRLVVGMRDSMTDLIIMGYARDEQGKTTQVPLLTKESELQDNLNSSPSVPGLMTILRQECSF